MKRPEIDKTKMRFSFTYVAVALALLFVLQGVLGSPSPATVPYSRFQTMLEKGQIEEALIGASSIRFKLRDTAPLPEDLQKLLDRQQPLAARWTGAAPERLFEVDPASQHRRQYPARTSSRRRASSSPDASRTRSGGICCSRGSCRSAS